jgi:ribosomal-protein-alanine N-acetyltransferase
MIAFRGTERNFVDDGTRDDVAALADIHEQSFHRPWSADEMAALLAEEGTVRCLVARKQVLLGPRRPVGFVIFRSAAGEAEILTIAVDPAHRGRGHGRQLMEETSRRLYRDRIEALFLEVEETNRAALALYRSLGFEKVGERAGYYLQETGQPGTALVMRLGLR